MQPNEGGRVLLELKEVAEEASQALGRLDAERLEGLAISCHELNSCLTDGNGLERAAQSREAGEAARAMAMLARVMEATRANISLLNRIKDLCAGPMEYGPWPDKKWEFTERVHGDN